MSIVIATTGGPLLGRTLKSIAECGKQAPFDRVIVVENGKRGDVERTVKAFDTLKIDYQFEPVACKSIALNRALAKLTDDLVVFLDDDVRVSPRVFGAYADAAASYPSNAYFGGPTGVDYEEEPPLWIRRFLPPSALGHEFSQDAGEVKYPSCFLGFNWAAYANELKACGGFNPEFGPGRRISLGDESFMQYELNRRGVAGLYVPQAKVWHYVPKNRCSVDWILRRAYPGGFAAGVFDAHCIRENRQRFGRATSIRNAFLRRARRAGWRSMLSLSREGRFGIRYVALYMKGYVAGFRYSRIGRPLDPRPPLECSTKISSIGQATAQ